MFIERSEHTARCARTHTYSNLCTQSHYAVYSSLQSTALHLQRSTVYSDLQRNSGLQSIASQRLQTPPLPLSGGVKLTMHLPREVEPVVRTRTPVTLPASQSVFMNTFRTREVGMCSMNVQNGTVPHPCSVPTRPEIAPPGHIVTTHITKDKPRHQWRSSQ